MNTIKTAKLKKPYWRADSKDASVYAYYPAGTVVSVISRGKGYSSIVKLPENEFDTDFRGWQGSTKDLKFN